jgi:hypothetical protein
MWKGTVIIYPDLIYRNLLENPLSGYAVPIPGFEPSILITKLDD